MTDINLFSEVIMGYLKGKFSKDASVNPNTRGKSLDLSKFHDFETIMETMSIINTYFEFIVQLN
jgi:hypothetical protein